MDVWREIGEQRRLKAGAGADLEHLVAWANLERAGHAAHRAGRRDGDAEADVEIMPDIGVLFVIGQAELLARRHQEGALVGWRPEVVEAAAAPGSGPSAARDISGPPRGDWPSSRRRMRPCSTAAGPSAARAAAGVAATTAAAAPSRNSRLSIKAPSIDASQRFGRCLTQIVRNGGKPAPIAGKRQCAASA